MTRNWRTIFSVMFLMLASACTSDIGPNGDVPETCGNGVIEDGDKCDGDELGGETCVSRGYEGGTLLCAMNCQFDVDACTFPDSSVIISDVSSNTITDGQTLRVSGSGFGTDGPDILVFDDFSRGSDGDPVTLNATVGAWTSASETHYGEDANGNMAGHLIEDDQMKQMHVVFDGVQEIFLSYRVRIPEGNHFPYSFAPNTFPYGSQWKLTWLMDGPRGHGGNDDICIPTWPNGQDFIIAGNDNAFQFYVGRVGTESHWFSFLGWNRFSAYLKGGASPEVDQGLAWSQGMSQEWGQHQFNQTPVIFDGDDTPDGYQFTDDSISQWNRLNVPGWQRAGDPNSAALYDDIYFATGPNAAARVEIGNKPIYANSTKLSISTPTSWSDTSIDVTARLSEFAPDEEAYLFVVNANGTVGPGFPVTVTH